MKIVICDDSQIDVKHAKELLMSSIYFRESDISTYTSSKNLMSDIDKGKVFDIAFLDVDMPYMNGLELGLELRKRNDKIIIIFISAYPEYAISAFNCEAFSYLTKPIHNNQETNDVLFRLHQKYKKVFTSHAVRINTEYRNLLISDIVYVECCKKHIIYHLENGLCQTTETLSQVYDVLKDYGFYQAHQGYIVNFDKIAMFVKYTIILKNGKILPVSKRRKTDMMLS